MKALYMTTPRARIAQAASKPQHLARKAIKHPRLLPDLLTGLEADTARIKYGCMKALRIISEEHPALLYSRFDFFVGLLNHENKILQWNAAYVLAQLVRVDTEDKFGAVFDRYFSPIPGPVMITAANVIQGGALIAQARAQLADRIAVEVLKVSKARYQTAECRNVAIGHAIVALNSILPLLRDPAPVIQFVHKQLSNPRPATRRKAEQFLKVHVKMSPRQEPLAAPLTHQ